MPIIESDIILEFPDDNFFRLCDCFGYKEIQNNFAEMDVCWYDGQNDILYVIELKNWGNNRLLEEDNPSISNEEIEKMRKNISEYRVRNLLKKSIDTTCMFMAVLLNSRQGQKIQSCAPFSITTQTRINLLLIINWASPEVVYISDINTKYKSLFGSYAKLFGIRTFLVLTKKTGCRAV